MDKKLAIKKNLGENIFGTSVRKAAGAKTVRPGDPNTTGANVVKPYETIGMAVDRAVKTGVINPSMLGMMEQLRRGKQTDT
jgi:hypothetical protein